MYELHYQHSHQEEAGVVSINKNECKKDEHEHGVLLFEASESDDAGEGMEMTDWDDTCASADKETNDYDSVPSSATSSSKRMQQQLPTIEETIVKSSSSSSVTTIQNVQLLESIQNYCKMKMEEPSNVFWHWWFDNTLKVTNDTTNKPKEFDSNTENTKTQDDPATDVVEDCSSSSEKCSSSSCTNCRDPTATTAAVEDCSITENSRDPTATTAFVGDCSIEKFSASSSYTNNSRDAAPGEAAVAVDYYEYYYSAYSCSPAEFLGGGNTNEYYDYFLQAPQLTCAETWDADSDSVTELNNEKKEVAESDNEDEEDNSSSDVAALPFVIMGIPLPSSISTDNISTTTTGCSYSPVLTPKLMKTLRDTYVPFCKSSDNFWLRYSMIRDGASMHNFLEQVQGAKYSILAVETTDGEIFGAFTTECWRKTPSYFGGSESFLWKNSKAVKKKNDNDDADDAKDAGASIDVYRYTGDNDFIQICKHDRITVGAGCNNINNDSDKEDDIIRIREKEDNNNASNQNNNNKSTANDKNCGYGLCIQNDMRQGTTSPCGTFNSPSLSVVHGDGSVFDIVNIELWSLTPCISETDAMRLEQHLLFIEQG